MIEKVHISDANVIEEIRDNIPVATQEHKGLLNAGSDRFVKANGLTIREKQACIKLYSGVGQTSVVALISTGRVEGSSCGVFLLSFSMASVGVYVCTIKKLNSGVSARFYYVKDGNRVSIYLVTTVDYSITHVSPLLESGNFSYYLKQEALPEGAIQIDVE